MAIGLISSGQYLAPPGQDTQQQLSPGGYRIQDRRQLLSPRGYMTQDTHQPLAARGYMIRDTQKLLAASAGKFLHMHSLLFPSTL